MPLRTFYAILIKLIWWNDELYFKNLDFEAERVAKLSTHLWLNHSLIYLCLTDDDNNFLTTTCNMQSDKKWHNLCNQISVKGTIFFILNNIDILKSSSFSSSESSKFDSRTISMTCYIIPYVNANGADSFCLCHKYAFPSSEAK